MVEFFDRFFRFGGTIQMIKQLLGDDEFMTWWMEQLKTHAKFKLVHDVFNPAADVLEATMLRLVEKGFSVDQFTWIGPNTPPDFTQDTEVVVALDVTLDSLQSTIEFAYEWAAEGQKNAWRWEGFVTTPDKLRLLQGSAPFQPFTLRWRRIKLNANVGKAPKDVRSPETSPGTALVLVAAQHPARVRMIKGKCLGWYVPGIECTGIEHGVWGSVPYIDFVKMDKGRRFLCLDSTCDTSNELAVPTFLE